jgi:hypothetical protein
MLDYDGCTCFYPIILPTQYGIEQIITLKFFNDLRQIGLGYSS